MNVDLNGTWWGFIRSEWVHPDTKKRLDPIEVILTIHQEGEEISCTMRTAEMTSLSGSERLTMNLKTKEVTLNYQYLSDPIPSVKGRSQIHKGTMNFTYVEIPKRQLIGRYYTDRETKGEIWLDFWTEDMHSRFPEGSETHPAAEIDVFMGRLIRILYVGASPIDSMRLRIDREYRDIKKQLTLGDKVHECELEDVLAATTEDLQRTILEYKPNILHLSGHGDDEGIYLEDDSGEAELVPYTGIVELVRLFKASINCVILNACFSNSFATEIANIGVWVIGIDDKIADDDAISFSIGFYMAISAGQTVEFAFESGKTLMKLNEYGGGTCNNHDLRLHKPGDRNDSEWPEIGY